MRQTTEFGFATACRETLKNIQGRHSDHHADPSRPYESLRSMFPPAWFAVMDPRVRATTAT